MASMLLSELMRRCLMPVHPGPTPEHTSTRAMHRAQDPVQPVPAGEESDHVNDDLRR